MVIAVSIENPRHLTEILQVEGIERVILSGDRYDSGMWKDVCSRIHEAGKKAIYAFPYVLRRESLAYYEKNMQLLKTAGWDGFLVRSLDAAGFLKENDIPGLKIFDQGMYTWNQRAIRMMHSLGADLLTLPYELRQSEMKVRGYEDSELVVYGRLPVMISAQCSRKTTGQCRMAKKIKPEQAARMAEFLPLKDRKKAEFMEDSHCRFCYSVIYNSVPLWLLDQIPGECRQVRLAFTDEAEGLPRKILTSCICPDGEKGWKILPVKADGDFTRGHFMRGVE